MDNNFAHFYKRKKSHFFIGLLFAGLIVAGLLMAAGMGAMQIPPARVFAILWAKLSGNAAALAAHKANEVSVVWDIRLPRILCSVLVGAGLSSAGVIFQSLLRNPLADPYTLGVSSGAAFGAALAIYLGITYGQLVSTSLFAFIFAFLTLVAVIFIAQKSGGLFSSSLVIAGIIASSILSSGISMLKMLAGENVSAIVFWLMGSLVATTWADVALVATVVLICGAIAFVFANDLNIMTMGDDTARDLGVNTKRITLLYLILGSLITAACVSVSGIIGFVGLVIPHILRFWLSSDNRTLLPLSALLGAFILMLADSATRLLSTSEIPVGVLTTLLGGPFFLYVFIRKPSRQKHGRRLPHG